MQICKILSALENSFNYFCNSSLWWRIIPFSTLGIICHLSGLPQNWPGLAQTEPIDFRVMAFKPRSVRQNLSSFDQQSSKCQNKRYFFSNNNNISSESSLSKVNNWLIIPNGTYLLPKSFQFDVKGQTNAINFDESGAEKEEDNHNSILNWKKQLKERFFLKFAKKLKATHPNPRETRNYERELKWVWGLGSKSWA